MSIDLTVDVGYTSADSRGCPKTFPTLANTWKRSPEPSRAEPEKGSVQGEVSEISATQRAQQTIKKIELEKMEKCGKTCYFSSVPHQLTDTIQEVCLCEQEVQGRRGKRGWSRALRLAVPPAVKEWSERPCLCLEWFQRRTQRPETRPRTAAQ